MKKTIIVAKAKNNVIGKDGSMPWHLPEDLKFFKQQTMGHFLLMGRKTYEDLQVELEGRQIIILTRNRDYQVNNSIIAHSIKNGLDIARARDEDNLYIAGGADVYRQTINLADKMYMTEINEALEGDTYFPEFDKSNWEKNKIKEYEQNNERPYSFTIYEYIKK